MQAKTERRLGVAAALALTIAAFTMPGVAARVTMADAAPKIHMAFAEQAPAQPAR